ncbi:17116_t:CDS:2 [Funneliformis geosporum]|nr:17116_t:CDS:2 [Funneliformis geosporum]
MSIGKVDNSTTCFNWLEKATSEDYIKYYDYSKFTNEEKIVGSFGKVFRANWNDSDTVMVLKSSHKADIKELINEIKMQREVDYHANIIKFYGISTNPDHKINKYVLVMEYADGGTLRSYLEENFDKLEWTDFGLSRKIIDATNHSTDLFGVVPYVDPKFLNIRNNNNYILNPKSDVYGVGVLLWQISSGHRPFDFYNEGYDVTLVIDIIKGRREKIIKDTPFEYRDLHASMNNYPIVQVYLANCYKDGYGIELNYN